MKLCFDATRFGFGLHEAVELSASKGIDAFEFSFEPFSTADRLDTHENTYLNKVSRHLAQEKIELACLNLNYCLDPLDPQSTIAFVSMIETLAHVANAVDCRRLSFYVCPGMSQDWKVNLETTLTTAISSSQEQGVKLLLCISTPGTNRGRSLQSWRALTPQDWRDILSICPGLGLSFSPADCVWQNIDVLQILPGFVSAIDHIQAHDVEINRALLADSGLFGPLWWRYRLPGKGQADWRQIIEALKLYGYQSCFSVQLDDEFIGDGISELDQALDTSMSWIAPLLKD